MKKKFELFLAALLVPIDYAMIIGAALAAYFLRYQDFVTSVRPVIFNITPSSLVFIAGIFACAWILIFAWFGLYTTKRVAFVQEISKIVQACTMSIMALTTYMVFWQENFASRFIILFTWIFSILFVTTGRLLLRFARQYFRTKGLGVYRTLLIGNTSVAETLKQTYATKPQLGIDVIAHIPAGENILFDIKKYNVDQVIQADSSLSRTISAELIDYCQREHIIYQYVGGNFESKVTNNEVFTIVGIPMIELKRTPLDGWGKILKRVLDIVGALFCIVLFSPIMIITAIAVKLTSKGPIIADVPPRAGQFHRPFEMFKFRSMYVGSHAKQKELVSDREGLFKMQDDPRLTSIGKFIRKTSIDELPQFFNVIIGNMSLVGPRPHFLNEYTPEQLRVLDIKPGITGLAQISGRSDLAFEDEIKLDLSYIENWSLWLDSWILLKTPIILFTKMKSAV